jgi:ADP-ribosylglycohydrolase
LDSSHIESWQRRQEEGLHALAETGQWQPIFKGETYGASEVLVICLPLLLFLSDQPQILRQKMNTIAQPQDDSPLASAAIAAYQTAIQWGTTEQLSGKRLFFQLKATTDSEVGYKVLETLQESLHQGATLQEAQAQLPATCQDIWLALYCFATTSEDLALSVRRAKTSTRSNPRILALVGALLGVHNGINAIPIPWRRQLQQERTKWKDKLRLMWATWSGNYYGTQLNPSLEQNVMTIAPSGVIQPRRSKN